MLKIFQLLDVLCSSSPFCGNLVCKYAVIIATVTQSFRDAEFIFHFFFRVNLDPRVMLGDLIQECMGDFYELNQSRDGTSIRHYMSLDPR